MVLHLNLDKGTVRQIPIDDLGMKSVSAKLVPRLLNDEQKQQRVDVYVRGCIQKFPDRRPGARNANGTALCH
jgi:hypothetical protein